MKEFQANTIFNASYRMQKNINSNVKNNSMIYHSHDHEYTGITYNCLGVSFSHQLQKLNNCNDEKNIFRLLTS